MIPLARDCRLQRKMSTAGAKVWGGEGQPVDHGGRLEAIAKVRLTRVEKGQGIKGEGLSE